MEIKEKILEEVLKKYDLYKGQIIDFKTFTSIYKEYENNITQIEFAELLGIKRKTFMEFKSKAKNKGNANVTILLNRGLSEKEKISAILELVNIYNLYKGKKVNYTLFRQMYEKFKTVLTEIEFAKLLGISETSLKNLRKGNYEARIFKNMKLSNDRIERTRKYIVQQYEGKRIYYENNEDKNGEVNFLDIYRPYRIYFSEIEFAELLGIKEKNLWYTKKKKANPKIKDIEKIHKVEEISKELEHILCCTKKEVEQLCERYDLSVDDFITYYVNRGGFFEPDIYKKILELNGKLYIKQIRMNEEDIVRYNDVFEHIAMTIIRSEINRIYGEKYLDEDLMSEIKIFIIYNCGDIIKNFEFDEKLMERMIWLRARKYTKIKFIQEYKKDIQSTELDQDKLEKIQGEMDINYDDYQIDDEIEKYDKLDERLLIEIFKKYLSEGYPKDAIIKKISTTYNLKQEQMLEMIKKYLLENRKVVQNAKGEYQIGEG